jgi:hypothetical protein
LRRTAPALATILWSPLRLWGVRFFVAAAIILAAIALALLVWAAITDALGR